MQWWSFGTHRDNHLWTRIIIAADIVLQYLHGYFMHIVLIDHNRKYHYEISLISRTEIFCQSKWFAKKLNSISYFGSMAVILKSMLWMDVKMFVAPCTTHSRVSGIAIGVHQERNTGSFLEHKGKTPEKWPSTKTTW